MEGEWIGGEWIGGEWIGGEWIGGEWIGRDSDGCRRSWNGSEEDQGEDMEEVGRQGLRNLEINIDIL